MTLLAAKNLRKTFKGKIHAVRGVSFEIGRGEAVGLVGESGCGKSTVAKIVTRLLKADAGEIHFEGSPKEFRRKVQVIFQNPFSSLDPRMKVGASLAEAYRIDGMRGSGKIRESVRTLLSSVDLPVEFERRLPHEISGGECQRVAIGRALSRGPELLVCDEPVSSLDLMAQARVLNLLLKLQKQRSMSLLFISHDLRVIRHLCDRVLVMKEGLICEEGNVAQLFENPQHPYTKELLFSSGLRAKP